MQRANRLSIDLATVADIRALWLLRRQLEDWIFAKGLNQWVPGEVPIETIEAQVEAGEWHVHRQDGVVIAALRVLWQDPDFWGPDDGRGVYVHGLMVDRGHAKQRLGQRLLDWAGSHGAAQGRSELRLDCAADNLELCHYYGSRGFAAAGAMTFENGLNAVTLWRRPLVAADHVWLQL